MMSISIVKFFEVVYIKKDYRKAERAVLKVGEVSQEKIDAAKAKVSGLSEEELLNRPQVVKALKEELLA